MALDRLRRLVANLGEDPTTERTVDSVRSGADRVDADPDLDPLREEPPDSGDAERDRRSGGTGRTGRPPRP